jgi:hypothetical protein
LVHGICVSDKGLTFQDGYASSFERETNFQGLLLSEIWTIPVFILLFWVARISFQTFGGRP